ncbi:MAG: DUF4179 domain-containing protein [Bacteroides sp.]|nr:DUF4179 domain-containing protein [Eubacterium sp.]MCM1417321.1 DUF4179 domain-containing protein [Roseburia sp.]MCM1461486.1 DUF4179 domain-containing protein [Bacteroides sp.]
MKNEYRALFDGIAPVQSDEELLRAILEGKDEKMNKTKRSGKKAILIAAAVAAVLGTTAVGAGAAFDWDLAAAFEGFFRNRSDSYGENPDARVDFTWIGHEIGESYVGEGYTLTIDGAVADENSAYFYYTLSFGEDFPYDYAHENVYEMGTGKFDWVVDLNTIKLIADGEPLNVGVSVSGSDCKWLDEKTVQGAFSVSSSEAPLIDRALTLTVGGLYRSEWKKEETETIDCDLSAELYFDGDLVYPAVTITPNAPIATADGSGTVETLTVSTFSAEYTLSGELDFADPALYYFVLTLKDGSTVEINDLMSTLNDGKILSHVNFLYPIDPAEVASARIGETVVEVMEG